MSVPAVLGVITRGDLAVLRGIATVRTAWLTHVMLDVNAALTSPWTVRLVMLGTIAVLVGFRRFRHLAAYLVIVLAAVLLLSAVTPDIGRMRPAGIQILGPWQGYSQPSRPVAALALALVGVLYTLDAGRAVAEPGQVDGRDHRRRPCAPPGCTWPSITPPTS